MTEDPPELPDLPPGPVAVMDGNCALCSFGVRMIHRLDRTGEIRICPIQTDLGRRLLIAHGLSPDDPSTWLLLEDGRASEGFDAMARVGWRSGGWGRLIGAVLILPRPVRHWLYARIARNRYAVFGRSDLCALPDPGLRARLIG